MKCDKGGILTLSVSGFNLTVNLPARRVWLDGSEVKLTEIEFRLCWLLINNIGLTIRYKNIINEVWGDENLAGISGLQVHMKHLRDKLPVSANTGLGITNIRGMGYRFDIR